MGGFFCVWNSVCVRHSSIFTHPKKPILPLKRLPDFLQRIEINKGRLLNRLALRLSL